MLSFLDNKNKIWTWSPVPPVCITRHPVSLINCPIYAWMRSKSSSHMWGLVVLMWNIKWMYILHNDCAINIFFLDCHLVLYAFALTGRYWFYLSNPGCRFALPWAMSLLPFQGVVAGWKPNERIALFHFPILLAFKWFLFQLRMLFLLLMGWKPNERIAQGAQKNLRHLQAMRFVPTLANKYPRWYLSITGRAI